MMNLDVSKFLPSVLTEYGAGWGNLINKIQEIVNYYLGKIYGIRYLYNPERTQLKDEIAYQLGAYVTKYDTTKDIMDKVGSAIHTNKNLQNFTLVWKPIIDKLTGQDSQIYKGYMYYQPFTIDVSEIDSPAYIEIENIDVYTKPKGVVCINYKVAQSMDVLDKLREQFTQMMPIYFKVAFGYETTVTADPFQIDNDLFLIDGSTQIEAGSTITGLSFTIDDDNFLIDDPDSIIENSATFISFKEQLVL